MLLYLPTLNASLNGLAFVLLFCGWLAIRRGAVGLHKSLMTSAFCVSAVFLACYVTYHVQFGSKPYPGVGLLRPLYFLILVPHILLAIGMLPMILIALRRALTGRFEAHKRIARITLPIWLYVSLTGVVVYWMLYHQASGG